MTEGPRFPHLFSPLRIGGVTLANRVVSSGHDTVMAADGLVTDQLVAYHEARAAGGVGLIVVQVAGVHESARYTSHMLMVTEDACIPGYRRLAERVHARGCAIVGQLFHPGREIMESQDGSAPVALAPSAVPTDRFHVMPRALPVDLVAEIVEGFGHGARRLREAGLDGAEIVASHGYLPSQFLNPRVNRREDAYGGSEENRLRFLRETVTAVRAGAGRDFVLGLRISADERSHDGLTAEEALAACRALDAGGGLDYVSVVAGSSATLAGSVHIVPPMSEPNAYTAPLAERVKEAVGVPVVVAGRINQPQEAERIIALGQADACAMTRALICDPLLAAKARDGRSEEIRACIGCNQACIGHFHAGYPISCIQHPETGRELRFGTVVRAARARDVMVVGGGPGGLKAAAAAAERGHRVTLYEAGPRVGGQVLLAAALPGRAEFGTAVPNLLGEATRASARVVTGTRVDRALVEAERPEVVIVATGARPRRPELELRGEPVVLDAWQAIAGEPVPAGRVVVADWRCDWVGMGVALLLAEQGHRVTLALDGYMAGQRVQQYVRDVGQAALHRAGVRVVPTVRVYGADADTVYLEHTLAGRPVVVEDVAALVLAQGHEPEDALAHELQGYGGEVVAIGDCLAPRTVEEAVLEGLVAASAIGG
jgi:2,4-dienoyl-CoA reductase-like NADH-dependent reductase (Old Yellow Enzyme family)